MKLSQAIINKSEKISIIGLGYVGMPLAIAFAKVADVIGFDISKEKIAAYLKGIDVTKEVGDEALKKTRVFFTNEEEHLKKAKFHIVSVPTPINTDKTPNLQAIKNASKLLGRNLVKGSIIVYESTVFPGVTEEICVPILEMESGLQCGSDFKVGYSPERINPGDKINRLETIVKVVAGMDEESLEEIAKVYQLVVVAGVYQAETIKIAEAAKVIENAQRDINIAFMNELAIIFNKMRIDTKAVLKAAATKWNFLNFTPGLVGGHCIGVDPYYLTYKAAEIGYHSQIILAGRKINDDMGKYVAENTVKLMINANKQIKGAKVAILGITFKENCPDVRNTKVIDVINELKEYGVNILVHDPQADKAETYQQYGIQLKEMAEIDSLDAIILAVPHDDYKNLKLDKLSQLYNHNYFYANDGRAGSKQDLREKKVLIDIKGLFNRAEAEDKHFTYWQL